jgi:hypothetical protein
VEDVMREITAVAGAVSETTGVEGGVDVDVTVTFPDGSECDGEVTLLPAEDGRHVYESWGYLHGVVAQDEQRMRRATSEAAGTLPSKGDQR